MNTIRFDVNDSNLREQFFAHHLMEAVAGLQEQTPSLWGNMSPQHMIEHLFWAFQCSTGALNVPCFTPENLLERTKRFLYDSRQTPRHFRNPLLGESPPPFQFRSLADAKTALREELTRFLDQSREQPGAIHVHPIFGPLNAEEWHRSHFKHCYHHLLHFGLIDQPGGTALGT
jgi:oxepin-CoA hydrolase/3-oxo-5,6-dehydrosuberyl-CoA semialdehyde dehydrogenase